MEPHNFIFINFGGYSENCLTEYIESDYHRAKQTFPNKSLTIMIIIMLMTMIIIKNSLSFYQVMYMEHWVNFNSRCSVI